MTFNPFAKKPIRQLLQANFEHAAAKLEEHACLAEQEQAFMNQYAARIARINAELAQPEGAIPRAIYRTLETNRYEAQRELEKHTCNHEMAAAFVALFMGRRDRLRREMAALPADGLSQQEQEPNSFNHTAMAAAS